MRLKNFYKEYYVDLILNFGDILSFNNNLFPNVTSKIQQFKTPYRGIIDVILLNAFD